MGKDDDTGRSGVGEQQPRGALDDDGRNVAPKVGALPPLPYRLPELGGQPSDSGAEMRHRQLPRMPLPKLDLNQSRSPTITPPSLPVVPSQGREGVLPASEADAALADSISELVDIDALVEVELIGEEETLGFESDIDSLRPLMEIDDGEHELLEVEPLQEDDLLGIDQPEEVLPDGVSIHEESLEPLLNLDESDFDFASLALDSMDRAVQGMIEVLQGELQGNPTPRRSARLNYELGRLLECHQQSPRRAQEHYVTAASLAPNHLPSVRGARRTLLAVGEIRQAIPYFDSEVRLTPRPEDKAALLLAKGRLIEDRLGEVQAAREEYQRALALEPSHLGVLKALEQRYMAEQRWSQLSRVWEQMANAITSDNRLRAAVVARRAHLLEVHLNQQLEAMALYETALQLDPGVAGVLAALKRLYTAHGRWTEVTRVLNQEVQQSDSANTKTLNLLLIAETQRDRLGNRREAIESLQQALLWSPNHIVVLEELARSYEEEGLWERLSLILDRLLPYQQKPNQQLALLFRLGQVARQHLNEPDEAEKWFQRALALDPAHEPTIEALSDLYGRRDAWPELILALQSHAQARLADAQQSAEVFARIAEVYEHRLGQQQRAVEHHERAVNLDLRCESSFKALTRLYFELARYRDLAALYERAVEEAVNDELAIAHLFRIGTLCENELAEPLHATHAYRRILRRDPARLGAVHALQRATERAGRHEELLEAIRLEEELVSEPARLVELAHWAGLVHQDLLDDKEGALARFQAAASIDPGHRPTLTCLAQLHRRAGRWQDLYDIYSKQVALLGEPKKASALQFLMGSLCEEQLGWRDQAKYHYEQAVRLDSTHERALRSLLDLLTSDHQWQDVIRVLELVESQSEDPTVRASLCCQIGRIYEQQLDSPGRAREYYLSALSCVPQYRPAGDALVRLLTAAGDWQGLVNQLQTDADTSDDPLLQQNALLALGLVCRDRLNDPRRATEVFERVLSIAPDNLSALLALEALYSRLVAHDKLQQTYRSQAGLSSDVAARAVSLRELGRVSVKAGADGEELGRIWEQVLAVMPSDLQTLGDLEVLLLAEPSAERSVYVDRLIIEHAHDPDLQAAHLTHLAETLERRGDDAALELYRKALTLDSQSLAATRGLSRLASKLDDPVALVEAAKLEASISRDKPEASRLIVQAGMAQWRRLARPSEAATLFEQALELWPDNLEVIAHLSELLLGENQVDRLIDALVRSADGARSELALSALWMAIAELQEQRLGNTGTAIHSLKRLLHRVPNHPKALLQLSNLYCREGRWRDAVAGLERVTELEVASALKYEAHLELARIQAERLGDPGRAVAHLSTVLSDYPDDQKALGRLLEIQLTGGDHQGALDSLYLLLQKTEDTDQRVELFLKLAQIERAQGRDLAARRAFEEAIVLEGSRGRAARTYLPLIDDLESLAAYADALSRHLRISKESGRPSPSAAIDLATVLADSLGDTRAALETLEAAIQQGYADNELRAVWIALLSREQDGNQALEACRAIIQRNLAEPQCWRLLSDLSRQLGQEREAALALAPIELLGGISEQERALLQQYPARPGEVRAGALSTEILRGMSDEEPTTLQLELLLRSMCEGAAKLYAVDWELYNTSSQDRLPNDSNHPVRRLVDGVGAAFGIEPLTVHIHRNREIGVGIELGQPNVILVPNGMASLSHSQQVFMIARALVYVARGLTLLWKLTVAEVEQLVYSVCRAAVPGFRPSGTLSRDDDEPGKRLVKFSGRRAKKSLEDAANAFSSGPTADILKWCAQVDLAANRAAMLLADDLVSVVGLLRDEVPSTFDDTGALLQSPAIHDLFVFWVSEMAQAVRQRINLV